MKVMERNVMRLLAVQQLRAAYGIKTKNWNKHRAASCKPAVSNSVSTVKKYIYTKKWIFSTTDLTSVCSDSESLDVTGWYGNFRARINKFTVVGLLMLLFSPQNYISIFLKASPQWLDPFVRSLLSAMSVTEEALFGFARDYLRHKLLYHQFKPRHRRAMFSHKPLWQTVVVFLGLYTKETGQLKVFVVCSFKFNFTFCFLVWSFLRVGS